MNVGRGVRTIVGVALCLAIAFTLVATACAPSSEEGGGAVVIRFSREDNSTQASGICAQKLFADKLVERLPAGSECRVYYTSSLYKPIDGIEEVSKGNLELCTLDSDGSGWEPILNVWGQPMVLSTVGAFQEFPNTALVKEVEKRLLAKNVVVLGWEPESSFMGLCAPQRMMKPADFKGKKIRISAPLAQGPMIEALGGSPVAIQWGDVPSSLQTKVIDAVITSVGGWNTIKDTVPYYTVFGTGGVLTEYYAICASKIWLDGLKPEIRDAVLGVAAEYFPKMREAAYSEDMLMYKDFGTTDPTKPGIYLASQEEIAAVRNAFGTAVMDKLISTLGEAYRPWIEGHRDAGAKLVAQYPPGTHPIEKTVDPESYRAFLGK